MYWRWKSLPELAGLPKHERERLRREALRDPFGTRDIGWLALVLGILAGVAAVVVSLPTSRMPVWIELPLWIAGSLALGKIFDAVIIARYRPVLRRLRGGD